MRFPIVPFILFLGLLAACAARPVLADSPGTSRPTTYAIEGATLVTPNTLKIRYSARYVPCYGKLGNVYVNQDIERVTITLQHVYPQPFSEHRLCPHYILLEWTTVKLDKPLGDRTVIDGSNGKTVHVKN